MFEYLDQCERAIFRSAHDYRNIFYMGLILKQLAYLFYTFKLRSLVIVRILF